MENTIVKGGVPQPCPKNEFTRVINEPRVKSICDKIKDLTENGTLFHDELVELKKQLPAFCFVATYEGKIRNNENAKPSGLAMLDIDHVSDPVAKWNEISEKAIQNGCYLAHITPSGHGLRIVYQRQMHMSLANSMALMAKELGFESFDKGINDAARVSYAVPEDYILYMDEKNLFEGVVYEDDAFEEIPTEKPTEVVSDNASKENDATEAKSEVTYPTSYKGHAHEDIITQMLEAQGFELVDCKPVVGQRHNALKFLCPKLRHICDFDYNFMMSVIPDWGLPKKEVEDLVKASLAYDKGKNAVPRVLENAITHLEYEKIKASQDIDFDEEDQSLPLPAKMPKVIGRILKAFPTSYQPAVLTGIMPVLGTLATRIRSTYNNEEQTPTFLSCITGPQASGKGSIKRVCDFLAQRLYKLDEIEEEKMRRYQEEKEKAKNKKEQPEDPKPCLRMLPEKVSNTSLSLMLDNARGQHVFISTPEIDSLAKNQKAVWSALDDVLRKSFDSDRIGQYYLGSYKSRAKAMVNVMMTGTPHAMRSFFTNVEGGLTSRYAFAQVPSTYGKTDRIMKPYSAADEKYIQEAMLLLMKEGSSEEYVKECGGKFVPATKTQLVEGSEFDIIEVIDTEKVPSVYYKLPKLEKAMQEWQEERALECRKKYDEAKDTFRRRAAVHGFRCGMIFYCLEGHRMNNEVIAAAKYCADLMLDQQMVLFGKPLVTANEKERENNMASSSKSSDYKGYIYDKMPSEISKGILAQVCIQHGESANSNTLRSDIARWVKFGMLTKVGKDRWVKPSAKGKASA